MPVITDINIVKYYYGFAVLIFLIIVVLYVIWWKTRNKGISKRIKKILDFFYDNPPPV